MTNNIIVEKAIDTVIFDFDGTIADTFFKIIEIINRDPSKFGIDGIDPTEIPRLKNLSIKYLLREFNVSILKVPEFIHVMQEEFSKEMTTLQPFEGISHVIQNLHELGYTLGILTSNRKDNVLKFLDFHNLDVFEFVVAERNLFGKHHALRKILKNRGLKSSNVIYIGDEVRDVIAANKVGVTSIAVTWGYNGEEILKKNDPDFIVSKPLSLLDIIKSVR